MGTWVMALFGDSLALVVFFSIFLGGLTFSVFSLLFGGDADHDLDVADHDAHFDADHGAEATGDDVHDVHAPGVLSVRGISLMMVGFGGVAFIIQYYTQYYTEKILFASVGGVLSGWLFAFALMLLLKLFYSQQSSSQVSATEIVGAYGIVSVSIPDGGDLGEVQLNVAGNQMNKPATSSMGDGISRNTRVRVRNYVGGRVVVSEVAEEG